MRETVKTDGTVTSVLDFIYDESGKPFAMDNQCKFRKFVYDSAPIYFAYYR